MSLFQWKMTGSTMGRAFAVFHEDPAVTKKNSGAFAEMVVCADLLRRGYEVFRSISAHASIDLIVHKGGVVSRVEVKTGHLLRGVVSYGNASLTTRIRRNREHGEALPYDLLAIYVREEDRILYRSADQEVEP